MGAGISIGDVDCGPTYCSSDLVFPDIYISPYWKFQTKSWKTPKVKKQYEIEGAHEKFWINSGMAILILFALTALPTSTTRGPSSPLPWRWSAGTWRRWWGPGAGRSWLPECSGYGESSRPNGQILDQRKCRQHWNHNWVAMIINFWRVQRL